MFQMPAPSDLHNARFGLLTVLSEAPRSDTRSRSWRCRCDCGAELVVLQRRLTTRSSARQQHACDACRAHACEICGAPVTASSTALTCSPECEAERKKRYQLEYYYKVRRNNPGEIAARSERARREWAALTPEERREVCRQRREGELKRLGRDAINARNRASHARRMEDPDYAEKRRGQLADWADANREAVRRHSREYRRRQRSAALAKEIGEAAELMKEKIDDDDSSATHDN